MMRSSQTTQHQDKVYKLSPPSPDCDYDCLDPVTVVLVLTRLHCGTLSHSVSVTVTHCCL